MATPERSAETGNRPARPRRMAVWREQHAWCARASLQRLGTRPLGTLLTITVMGVALALPLTFWLLLGNVQRLGHSLGQDPAINVFMQPGTAQPVVEQTAASLRDRADVGSVHIKSPDDGMHELSSTQGFSQAFAALPDNPLPYVLVVTPRQGESDAATGQLVKVLKGMSQVDFVQDDGAWRQRLHAIVDLGQRGVGVLAVLLGLAALLVVGNSVRLDIQGRADEIAVLQLVGASRAFVRRPYLYAGLWYGLASGVLAVLVVLLLELTLAKPVAQLASSYAGGLPIQGLGWAELVWVPLAAAAMGWLGARLVSARMLRISI